MILMLPRVLKGSIGINLNIYLEFSQLSKHVGIDNPQSKRGKTRCSSPPIHTPRSLAGPGTETRAVGTNSDTTLQLRSLV